MQVNPQDVLAYGPWPLGMVNAVDDHSVPADGLLAAEDVNIDRHGVATTRRKWAQEDGARYSSIFKHNSKTYAVRNGQVGVVGDASFTAIAPVTGAVCWTVLDGAPVYSDYDSIRTIRDEVAYPLGAGYYENDEQEEYQLDELPGGDYIHAWQGRLLVARGSTFMWSEAMRFGVYSAARNVLRFGQRIFWVAPLSGGVYVGLRNSVVFLSGTSPNEFSMRTVGDTSARGVSAVYDTRHKGTGGAEFALWFTEVGIAVGQPSGAVEYPQADRLEGLPLHAGSMVVEDDRVFIFSTQDY